MYVITNLGGSRTHRATTSLRRSSTNDLMPHSARPALATDCVRRCNLSAYLHMRCMRRGEVVQISRCLQRCSKDRAGALPMCPASLRSRSHPGMTPNNKFDLNIVPRLKQRIQRRSNDPRRCLLGHEPHSDWSPKAADDAVPPSLLRVGQPHVITRADAASEGTAGRRRLWSRAAMVPTSGCAFVGVRREPLKWPRGAARRDPIRFTRYLDSVQALAAYAGHVAARGHRKPSFRQTDSMTANDCGEIGGAA